MARQEIVRWWKTQKQLDDWLFDVRDAVNSNLYTTDTYKKRRLKELKLYENYGNDKD